MNIRIVCVLAAVLTFSQARAVPVSQVNIPQATAVADLIVVGQATWLETNVLSETHHPAAGSSAILTVKSDRILKGKLPVEGGVTIKADVSPGTALIPTYGVFFLHATGDGTYVGADPRAISVPAVRAAAATTRDPDPLVAVAQELAAVLATPASQLASSPTSSKGATALQQAEWTYTSAKVGLRSIPIKAAEAPLETALQSTPDTLSQCWLATALIEQGVPVSVEAIKTYLKNPPPGTEMTRMQIILSIRSDNVSSDLAPTLVEFLGLPDVEIRRAAASGLRSIGNGAAVKALAVTALKDEDREVRYYAETGLCWATKTSTPPCDVQVFDFTRDETPSRTYWAQWTKDTYH